MGVEATADLEVLVGEHGVVGGGVSGADGLEVGDLSTVNHEVHVKSSYEVINNKRRRRRERTGRESNVLHCAEQLKLAVEVIAMESYLQL